MTIKIDVYQRFDEVPLTRAQWNDLTTRSQTNTIFQTHEWVTAWWNTYGGKHNFYCLTASRDGMIIGLAPFMHSASSPLEFKFLADPNSDYCDFPINGSGLEAMEGFVSHLANGAFDWHSISLRNVPDQSETHGHLKSLCSRYGLILHASKRICAPEIRFDNGPDAYRHKYSVRRHSNRLQKLGRLNFRVASHSDDLPGMLSVLFRLHISRYRDKGERSFFEDPLSRRFYDNLARELIGNGWLHFSELTLDDIPIAVHFGFEYDRVLTWYKPAFDIAYRRYSPGTVMMKHLIDYAIDNGLRAFDYSIGEESFKNRFCNSATYNRNLAIYKNRPSAIYHIARNKALYSIKKASTDLGRLYASSKRRHTDT